MVEWLRDVGMPAEYVNKLARMFQDIKVSEDLNQEFKDTNRGAHVAGEGGGSVCMGIELMGRECECGGGGECISDFFWWGGCGKIFYYAIRCSKLYKLPEYRMISSI